MASAELKGSRMFGCQPPLGFSFEQMVKARKAPAKSWEPIGLQARQDILLAGCDYRHQRGAQARLSAPFPYSHTPQATVI